MKATLKTAKYIQVEPTPTEDKKDALTVTYNTGRTIKASLEKGEDKYFLRENTKEFITEVAVNT